MSKGSASQTPVMRQYLEAKAAHPDALMLFRMGDFYELFFEDAVVAARALDLTLTARNKGADDEIPMAGVPHHAASAYVQRLLEQGFKVAICEQMADPVEGQGHRPARGRPRREPGHRLRRRRARGAPEPLPGRRRARRRARRGLRHRGARSVDRRAPGVRGGRRGRARSRSSFASTRARRSSGPRRSDLGQAALGGARRPRRA